MLSTTATILAIAAITATPVTADGAADQFNRRVAAYIALHEHLETTVPPLRVSSDARDIYKAVQAMASAERAARADAKAGDIFAPEVAIEFRRRLDDGLRAAGYDAAALLVHIVDENTDDGLEAVIAPAVNQPLGCSLAMTPPFVFKVLPALPGELQYRFVGRDLVLFDTHASLVIDILSDALPVN
jgi:hypothetical protein